MDNNSVFKKYVLHTFLRHFSLTMFYTFGALLIYSKTNSILLTLVYGLATGLAGLFMRSFGIVFLWKHFLQLGLQKFMALGLGLISFSFFGLFFLQPETPNFEIILILLAVLQDFGAGMYWIPSNAIMFSTVGKLSLPGKSSSIISITRILAQVLGAFLGIFLGAGKIILLLPLAGILLLTSTIPLNGIKLPAKKEISLKKCLKSISLKTIFGNLDLDNPIRDFVLPLIILLAFSSIQTSIFVIGLSAIGSAVFVYFTGKLKDSNNHHLNVLAIPVSIVSWILYAFLHSPVYFIILGIVEGIAFNIIHVGRNAKLSREIANTKQPIEATIGIEISRLFGTSIVFVFLIISFLVLQNLPQTILLFQGLLILPSALYAIGKIDKQTG